MKKTNRKVWPIRQRILFYMSILLIVEFMILAAIIFNGGGGVVSHLNRNAQDILYERVVNRANYLENEMLNLWSGVDHVVSVINQKTQKYLDDNSMKMSEFEASSESCADLIYDISSDLISVIRSNRVTGAYVMFSTADFDEMIQSGNYVSKPGIYLRDVDPVSTPSARNQDILIERGPISVVNRLKISTNTSWRPQFDFVKFNGIPNHLYTPYQRAYIDKPSAKNYADYGYWETSEFIPGSNVEVITYSVPLIFEDGSLYGILGIDIATDYLRDVIPYHELADNKAGSYILAIEGDSDTSYDNVLINGPMYHQRCTSSEYTDVTPKQSGNKAPGERYTDYYIDNDEEKFYCIVEYLTLYNADTPFSSQKWALIGTVRDYELFSFSNRITNTIALSIFATMIVGIFGSYIVGRTISNPVVKVTQELDEYKSTALTTLSRSNISEIDLLIESIEGLSRNVFDSALKFTRIIEMASVNIGGYEIDYVDNTFFISQNFFTLFGNTVDTKTLTHDSFTEIIDSYKDYLISPNDEEGERLYKIPLPAENPESGIGAASPAKHKYIRLKNHIELKEDLSGKSDHDRKKLFGLAEDVTRTMVEKETIEYERDHDLLTGLKNRRAFYSTMKSLFAPRSRDNLKISALVMMDLDNLKHINDTYGHDYGDRYIQITAEAFMESAPPDTVISKISGDEFFLFMHGYSSKAEIRDAVAKVQECVARKRLPLPNKEACQIKISGGIAWYPDDSKRFEELMKFADFAMNRVKQVKKGELIDFDVNAYNREAYLLQNRAELTDLIEKSLVLYFFQPIVDVRTGEIFGYEALMRPNMTTIKTAKEVITLAKMEGKLTQIESMTLSKVMQIYAKHVRSGDIASDAKIFINSISGQIPSDETLDFVESTYPEFLKNIVIELSDEERINGSVLKDKLEKFRSWNAEVALSAQGGIDIPEITISHIAPDYIKLDLNHVRTSYNTAETQSSITDIISNAQSRNIKIIAAGIESDPEITLVKSLNTNFLQGYHIAKPSEIPAKRIK